MPTIGRMTGSERRSQLVGVAKGVFAQVGYEAASVEEIAAQAGVSKPIVYEHFGGKEGLYAVVVDRETTRLLQMVTSRLGQHLGARQQVLGAAMAFLDYIESDPDGFRVLTRDSPSTFGGSMAGLLADVADKAAEVLTRFFVRNGLPVDSAPLYAHALVGMVVHVGGWWAEVREPAKEVVAAHLAGLAYGGLSRLPADPTELLAGLPVRPSPTLSPVGAPPDDGPVAGSSNHART